MYLVFTRMPGESYRRRLGSLLLYVCDVFRALINSLVLVLTKLSRDRQTDSERERQRQTDRQTVRDRQTEGQTETIRLFWIEVCW